MRGLLAGIEFLVGLPLAVLSWLARRVVQFRVLAIGCGREYRRDPDAFRQWRVNSPERLSSRLALLRVMMVGPRWNTAALCASAGPFRVERRLVLSIGPMARASGFWTLLLFRVPGVRRAIHWSSLSVEPDRERIELEVEPGDYFLNARLYRTAGRVPFPAVEVDGREGVAEVESGPEANAYLGLLAAFSNRFYATLDYHVVFAIRWRRFLPESWLRALVVPVGDPATRFLFGVIRRGESLRLDFPAALLDEHAVFATIYDRASFPVAWYEVSNPGEVGPPAPASGFYLVRTVRVAGTAAANDPLPVATVAPPGPAEIASPGPGR